MDLYQVILWHKWVQREHLFTCWKFPFVFLQTFHAYSYFTRTIGLSSSLCPLHTKSLILIGRVPETNTKQELVKVGIWRCSICTFDNRASMNVCDVCGNPKQELVKAGVWCCPICTFDNEDTTNLCDMCGVLRNPLIKGGGGKASAG